jgi:pimeloyl-ACP methyl ester carboxylesterase
MGPVRPPEGPKAIGSAQHAMFRLFYRMQPVMGGIFSLGRAMSLNAPDSMYRFILARASLVDRRILMRAAVQRNLLDGVTEGVRPGIQASVQEMRIFGMPWNLPFAAIKARTLLWQGTADRNVPVAAALRLAQLIPSCELIRLEGVGHYWIFEHIDEVLTKIKQVMISQKNA